MAGLLATGERRPAVVDVDAADLGGQLERLVEAEPFGIVGGARVVVTRSPDRKDFGIGMPLTSARLELEAPLPSFVVSTPVAVTGNCR